MEDEAVARSARLKALKAAADLGRVDTAADATHRGVTDPTIVVHDLPTGAPVLPPPCFETKSADGDDGDERRTRVAASTSGVGIVSRHAEYGGGIHSGGNVVLPPPPPIPTQLLPPPFLPPPSALLPPPPHPPPFHSFGGASGHMRAPDGLHAGFSGAGVSIAQAYGTTSFARPPPPPPPLPGHAFPPPQQQTSSGRRGGGNNKRGRQQQQDRPAPATGERRRRSFFKRSMMEDPWISLMAHDPHPSRPN